MCHSSSLPPYCSPSEAELDPPRPVKLLWIFTGVAENRTWPYKDIIFYHKLSKHHTDTRRRTNPPYTALHSLSGTMCFMLGLPTRWQALLSSDKATSQRGVTGRRADVPLLCHSMGVTSFESQGTRACWVCAQWYRQQLHGRPSWGSTEA